MIDKKEAMKILVEIEPFLAGCGMDVIDLTGIVVASTERERIGIFSEQGQNALHCSTFIDDSSAEILFRFYAVRECSVAVCAICVFGQKANVQTNFKKIERLVELLAQNIIQKHWSMELLSMKNRFAAQWLLNVKSQYLLSDESFLLRGKMLGIDIHIPRYISVIRFETAQTSHGSEDNIHNIMFVLNVCIGFNPDNLAFIVDDAIVLCLCDRGRKIDELLNDICASLRELNMQAVYCGVSGKCSDPALAAYYYRNAESACKIASLSADHSIVFYDELSIEQLLDSIPVEAQESFVNRVFRSCEDSNIAEWTDILSIYFKNNGSLYKAAEELYMHKNTLQYRINKIKEKTNYDPRDMQDSLTLYLATILYKKIELRKLRVGKLKE